MTDILNRVFDPRVPLEPAYPSTTPSIADAAYFKTKPNHQDDSDTTSLDSGIEINIDESYDSAIQHAPPGFVSLLICLFNLVARYNW